MKLRGLVITGMLFLTLGGVSGWLILGQNANVVSNLNHTELVADNKNPKTSEPKMWLTWYGDDAIVYRLRVNAKAYAELYASLRQSLAQDQVRMESISGNHIAAELTPIFAELPPKLDNFLNGLFDITSSTTFLGQGLSVASETIKTQNNSPEQIAIQVSERVRTNLADQVVTKFRDTVLLPGFTLRALREASGRAFAMMCQDILENCDRYDRAFQDFVLKTPGTVESRDGEAGWHSDPSWQQGNATFLSLCPDLRRSIAGHLSDTPLVEAFTAAEEMVHAQALELVRPLTETSVDVALNTAKTEASLNSLLPASIASAIAYCVGPISSTWSLTKQALDQLGGVPGQRRLETGLKATLDSLQTDSIQRLHSLYRSFIAAEMERMGLNLAARSEGEWSHQ